MSQPTPYTRKFSFTNDQAANPSTKTPGNQLDIEYNAILLTLNQTLANLALIQRDDGQLASGSVGTDQLSSALFAGLTPATLWTSPANYAKNSTVFFGSKLYRCLVSHISGTFATDLANGDWLLIADFTTPVPNAPAYTIRGNPTGFAAAASDIDITSLPVKATPVSADIVLIQDSAASNAFKKTTVSSLLAGRGATVISANTTVSVPSAFADINLALASIAGSTITPNATVTISLAAGRYTYTSSVVLRSPYRDRIAIVGATPTTTAINNSAAATGATNNWTVNYTVTSSAGIAVGDVVSVDGTASSLHRGAWKVTAVPDATHVTVKNTMFRTAPPSGNTGTMTIYPTQLFFNGVTAFDLDGIGALQNVAVVADSTGSNTFGVIVKGTASNVQQGTAYLGPGLAINGFTADGVRANYGGVIQANGVLVSNSGNNGFLARDLANISCQSLCLSSGNGFLTPPGGGNGYLSQLTSSMYHNGSNSVGNFGEGYFSRTASALLIDNVGLAFASFNNNNFRASFGGYLQAEGVTSTSSANHGFWADGGRMLLTNAVSSQSGGNGFKVEAGGYIDATGSTSGATFNGYVSVGPGSQLYCPTSNVTAVGGGANAYLATDWGWIVMTGATGLVTASPTVNAVAAPAPSVGYIRN